MAFAEFQSDPHPGKPRILFIGHAGSSHTHAWVGLVQDAPLNLRFFAIPGTQPPVTWPLRTYIPNQYWGRFDPAMRRVLYTLPNLVRASRLGRILAGALDEAVLAYRLPERWLERIVRRWQPDIVHTLGLNPAAYLAQDVLARAGAGFGGRWVVTVRGGPDLALNRLLPEHQSRITQVLQRCDQVIADNELNYAYAAELGMRPEQRCPLGAVPGAGGVDLDTLASPVPPSQRERIIVWPKGYENIQGKALPVFEALELAWPEIQPCSVYISAVIQDEVRLRFLQLPDEIRASCHLLDRVPHVELLALMRRARVMLAPSLLDGVPNVLYEAMATGACPVVSPLATLTGLFTHDRHVLYAHNLYPADIARELVRAMTDDCLVDAIATENRGAVAQCCDRKVLKEKILSYYQDLM